MGINAEFVRLIADLRARDLLRGDSVIEAGAQDVCVVGEVVAKILAEYRIGVSERKSSTAVDLYSHFGWWRTHVRSQQGCAGAVSIC